MTKPLRMLLLLGLSLALVPIPSCAKSEMRKIRVMGMGVMLVPRGSSPEEIDQRVIDRYGTKLFWELR